MFFYKFISAALIAVLATINMANSQSFDCKKSSAKIEKIICENYYLSALDSALLKLYKSALKKNKDILKNQKDWLKTRDQKNEDILIDQYEKRIIELAELSSYQLKFGDDVSENLILSLIISNKISIFPEQQTARLQTKSIKLNEKEALIAFAIISGNRETEYQFIKYDEKGYKEIQVPTFDLEKNKIISNKRLSGVINFKQNELEIFSGSGNTGGRVFVYTIKNSDLTLERQSSIGSTKDGNESVQLEYKK